MPGPLKGQYAGEIVTVRLRSMTPRCIFAILVLISVSLWTSGVSALMGITEGDAPKRFALNDLKGRTCSTCHDVHDSNEERHIREEFQFGKTNMPINYVKTATGGGCLPGCHRERGYDRVNMVINGLQPATTTP